MMRSRMQRPAYQLGKRLSTNIALKPPSEPARPRQALSALSRLPTKTLLRSLVLTSLMSRGWLLRPALAALGYISKSKSALLDADRNPVLNKILRWTIYDHFCAGVNRAEITRSIAEIKRLGFQGVILGYAKEIVLDPDQGGVPTGDGKYGPGHYKMVEEWKNGTLDTLRMLESGDFLGVKLTGAGPISVDALQARGPVPSALQKAIDEIVVETEKQGCRLWIDAEQQVLQRGLDEWAICLMRKYNRNGRALVYNTIQAYLKGSTRNAERHITLAASEGWALGVKLVRGAYIEHEVRSLIHDTKEATDRSYDYVANMLISQVPPVSGQQFPSCALFLATHNAASAERAIATHRQRLADGLPAILLECGQLVGMADELSCQLIVNHEECLSDPSMNKATVPGIFKCMAWGSVGECVGFLHRRAVENRGAVERTQHMVAALKTELFRRMFG